MKIKATLYASDRDIYEALTSRQKKFSNDLLIELLRDRGIIVSENESRENLIEYLSIQQHDFNDYEHLADLLQPNQRQERVTSTMIKTDVNSSDINNIVNKIKKKRDGFSEAYEVTAESEKKTVIKVDYTEMDLSKTRLRQKVEKTAYIEVLKDKDGNTTIRRPANEKIMNIVDDIITDLKEEKEEDIHTEDIDLSGIDNSEVRTKFFTTLIRSIDSVKLDDVSIVKVDRINYSLEEVDEEFDEEDVEEISQRMLGEVKKVALTGQGLLYSEEYQHLLDNGFYIYSIVWQAIEIDGEKNKIEFEATFNNSKECKEFKYYVKGKYIIKTDDSYSANRRTVNEAEREKYLLKIEDAVRRIYDKLKNE